MKHLGTVLVKPALLPHVVSSRRYALRASRPAAFPFRYYFFSRARTGGDCARGLLAYSVARFSARTMQTGNSILIAAARREIFETAADLAHWPDILPHYRYVRFLERGPDCDVVEMAARRSGVPISWTSEFVADREQVELRFLHVKAFTRGMRVVWTFRETPAGVLVEIMHELRFRIPALAPIAEPIIGGFFIHHVANQTLRCMKAHLEGRAHPQFA